MKISIINASIRWTVETESKSVVSAVNTTCNKEIVLTSYYPWDIISTPNYPFVYPNNLNCTIKVSVVGDFAIEVLFTDFLMEEGGERYVCVSAPQLWPNLVWLCILLTIMQLRIPVLFHSILYQRIFCLLRNRQLFWTEINRFDVYFSFSYL